MIHHGFLSIVLFLSLLIVSSSFLPHANVVGPLDVFVDSLTVSGPSTSSHHHKIQYPRCRLLSSNKKEQTSNDNLNVTSAKEPNGPVTQNKTKGYRPIEEWHEETRDPKHAIQQLKEEKARWKKTFDNLES